MLHRPLSLLIALVANVAVTHAQPLDDPRLPEPCREVVGLDPSKLKERKKNLEWEVRRLTALAPKGAAERTQTSAEGVRKAQEELLKLTFQIECLDRTVVLPSPRRNPAVAKSAEANAFEITTYYATNRKKSGSVEPAALYGSSVVGHLDYGRAVVSIPANRKPGEIQLPSLWRLELQADPNKYFVLKAVAPMDWDIIRKEMSEKLQTGSAKSLLLFVHGYYTSFRDAAFRTAQMAHDLGFPGMPFFFSWPSSSNMLGYWHDGEAAQLSEPIFERLLDDLAQLPVTDVYIIAHSMGSRIVGQALKARVDQGKETKHIRELLLAAPDINAEIFRSVIAPKLAAMQNTRTTVYASSSDLALRAAKIVYGFERVGETANGVFVYPGLDTIDASSASAVTRAFGHSYVMDSPSLLRDIESLIKQKVSAKLRGLKEAGNPPSVYWKLP